MIHFFSLILDFSIVFMKILHTADWHLGKRLDRFSRLEEQVEVLGEIVKIADENAVDLVLIAGDLFDSFNPSIEATELFYKTLKQLTNNGKRPVIAIAGNHDAPDRIDAPYPLAYECGIILIGHPNALISPLKLENFHISKTEEGFIEIQLNPYDYPARILHTAYANEVRLKTYFGEEKDALLNHTLKQKWTHLAHTYCDEKGVNLLLTHLYMNRRNSEILEEPDGEKPLKIGNAEMIYTDCIPPQIQYTALGHLHGFHNIGTAEQPIVYSSSILAYSFSEAGQKKCVTIVDAKPHQPVDFQKIELTKGKPLARKSFNDIDQAIHWLSMNKNKLVELTIESETFLSSEDRKRIFEIHNGIVHLIPKIKNRPAETTGYKEIELSKAPEELFVDFFKMKKGNQAPNEEIMALLKEIIHADES